MEDDSIIKNCSITYIHSLVNGFVIRVVYRPTVVKRMFAVPRSSGACVPFRIRNLRYRTRSLTGRCCSCSIREENDVHLKKYNKNQLEYISKSTRLGRNFPTSFDYFDNFISKTYNIYILLMIFR